MAPPPKDEPLLDLDQIQGNVLPGFKKDHQHFVFFSINDPAAARTWLNKLHTRLSSAAIVLDAHRVWKRMKEQRGKEPDAAHFLLLNIALSAGGLAKLISKADVDGFEDVAFKLGLSEERSKLIGDPASAKEPGHAANWLVGGPKHPVDGVLILASDDLTWLEEEQRKLAAELSAQGMKIEHVDRGDVSAAPTPGHEQFGFKDLVSSPAVRGRWPTAPYDFVTARTLPSGAAFDALRADFAAPGNRLIWPGHIIFGYGRQAALDPRVYEAANTPKGPAWAANGSFMVYRRLRQHPDVFWRFVEDAAKRLAKTYPKSAPDKDRLAACFIGRWKSGTPLTRSPDKDIGIVGDGLNYFTYDSKQAPALPGDTAPQAADPDGLTCPVGAHIRKVNPRDQATDKGISEQTPPHSILRRGITYATSDSDKGLLFVAYQSSIVDQFEFLMQMWMNKQRVPRPQAGCDPILSQTPGRVFSLPIDGKVERIAINKTFIEATGGEYFFAPSIGFFKNTLASGAKKTVAEDVQPFELVQSEAYAKAGPGFEEQATPAPPPATKTRVGDQFAIPFRWIARVSLEKRGTEDSHGSGVLISDVHVLTAAHVVWPATVSPAEYSVKVTLAQDGSNFLEDRIGVSRIDIPKRYRDGGYVFDYAILTLDSPMADRTYKDLGGVRLCYWGSSKCGAGTTAKPVDAASLNGQVAVTAGYPNDKGGKEMWVVTGTMSRSVGGTVTVHYTGELIEGQSGSPAWIEQNGARNIVGIVVSRGTFNRLYPLSWDMVEELNGWMLRAEKKPQLQAENEPEDVQPFELRHRAEEDQQETEMASTEITKDDSSPLPFDELVTLDGAEDDAATEVDEPLARDAGMSTSGTTGAPGKPVGESRFWTNANRTHHVVFPGLLDAHFDFTPTDAMGESGSVIGIGAVASGHGGSYKISQNTADAFEMRVTIGTSGNPTKDMDATLVIDKTGAYVSGKFKGKPQGPGAPIEVRGAGTEKNPFRAAFPSQELVWFLP
jgi:Dyp-type peroxidase family